jgi:hypothetical protein
LYGVMFDPDAYPMNWSWYDGKMSIEQYEHEHPLDMVALEKANGSGDEEAEPVEAAEEEQAETTGNKK